MSQTIQIKQIVEYGGHNISSNGSVNLTVKSAYSELVNTIKLMQLLNNDITIKAKTPNSKPFNLGVFRIKNISVSDDGESKIKFNGLSDYIEVNNLNSLILSDDEVKEFAILLKGEVEDEEGDSDEE